VKTRYFVQLIALSALWGASFLFLRVASPVLGPNVLAVGRIGLATVTLATHHGGAETALAVAALGGAASPGRAVGGGAVSALCLGGAAPAGRLQRAAQQHGGGVRHAGRRLDEGRHAHRAQAGGLRRGALPAWA
jgi:hypothetical protein